MIGRSLKGQDSMICATCDQCRGAAISLDMIRIERDLHYCEVVEDRARKEDRQHQQNRIHNVGSAAQGQQQKGSQQPVQDEHGPPAGNQEADHRVLL